MDVDDLPQLPPYDTQLATQKYSKLGLYNLHENRKIFLVQTLVANSGLSRLNTTQLVFTWAKLVGFSFSMRFEPIDARLSLTIR